MAKFYDFSQNNPGGHFEIDDDIGIGPCVWIEAVSRDAAISRAESIGIYFDGVDAGIDCPCCGDRWHTPGQFDEKDAPEISPKWHFSWHDTVYVHHLDGTIDRIKKPHDALGAK